MGTKKRRERERPERREKILVAASKIVDEEGPDNLSIRKIANRIECSPGLIYYYFRNKDEILDVLMERGFQKIVDGLEEVVLSLDHPEHQFRQLIRSYINNALANPKEYKSILLNSSPGVLKYTAVLFPGASVKESIGMVHRFLKGTYFKGCQDESIIERTVQIVWAAMFGLITRMLIEEELVPEQRESLIEQHIEMMLGAVNWMAGKMVKEE